MKAAWQFLRVHKRYWLLPAFVVLVLLVALLVLAGNPTGEFRYNLF